MAHRRPAGGRLRGNLRELQFTGGARTSKVSISSKVGRQTDRWAAGEEEKGIPEREIDHRISLCSQEKCHIGLKKQQDS